MVNGGDAPLFHATSLQTLITGGVDSELCGSKADIVGNDLTDRTIGSEVFVQPFNEPVTLTVIVPGVKVPVVPCWMVKFGILLVVAGLVGKPMCVAPAAAVHVQLN